MIDRCEAKRLGGMPRTTKCPPIYLFAAEAEFAQGHFSKSHAQNVPARKSLRRIASSTRPIDSNRFGMILSEGCEE